ncbi:MAG: endonuclease/exonuclease/phosphatase family protein [Bacteroidota bacterium]
MKKITRILIWTVIIVMVFIASFLNYLNRNDYDPPQIENVYKADKNVISDIDSGDTITIMSWNIGYAGLGSDMDFFYDGGKKTCTSYSNTVSNLKKIKDFLTGSEYLDFYIFQEVDSASKRSYYLNEFDSLSDIFKNYTFTNAINYAVKIVPFPLKSPMGKVNSGIMTFSKYIPEMSVRHSFPENFYWPKSLFMPDRCFMVNYYVLKNNKRLVLINTHNSAFDDGSLRKEQLNVLKSFAEDEYKKGNYVVVGGDWNQCPCGISPDKFSEIPTKDFILTCVEKNVFPEEWDFIYDEDNPTNRYLNIPYTKGLTATVTLDFFIVSPNIKTQSVKVIDLGFEYSDHQPVVGHFFLN